MNFIPSETRTYIYVYIMIAGEFKCEMLLSANEDEESLGHFDSCQCSSFGTFTWGLTSAVLLQLVVTELEMDLEAKPITSLSLGQ